MNTVSFVSIWNALFFLVMGGMGFVGVRDIVIPGLRCLQLLRKLKPLLAGDAEFIHDVDRLWRIDKHDRAAYRRQIFRLRKRIVDAFAKLDKQALALFDEPLNGNDARACRRFVEGIAFDVWRISCKLAGPADGARPAAHHGAAD